MKAFAVADHGGQQLERAAPPGFRLQLPGQLIRRLRLDGNLAAGTMRDAQAGEQQAEEMVNFGYRGHRALAAAPRGALFNADGRRQPGDKIDLRPRNLVHELPGIGVHGVQEAALSLGKKDVKHQGALARTADAGDDHKLVARDGQRQVLQVMLARPVDHDERGVGGSDGGGLQHGLLITRRDAGAKRYPSCGKSNICNKYPKGGTALFGRRG